MKNRKLGFFGRMFGTKKSDNERYDAFISYRRETGSDLASLLKIQLENTHHKRIQSIISEKSKQNSKLSRLISMLWIKSPRLYVLQICEVITIQVI